MQPYSIDPDIRRAATLPGRFYTDEATYRRVLESVFARTWHLVADASNTPVAGHASPVTLLPGSLDEPALLTTSEDGRLRALSNVCTHRGNILLRERGPHRTLICRYHGRRFDLDGRFRSMPECEGAIDFPRPSDNLPAFALASWEGLVFCSLNPAFSLLEELQPLHSRLSRLPWSALTRRPDRCRDYLVEANWALYCDNYLEGFHIPYVHAGLNEALDYASYTTELFPHASLQIGVARDGEDAFDAHPSSQTSPAMRVAAYYWFLFPNTMLNFYPWGLSVNIVEPLGVGSCRVRYLTYVGDENRLDKGAGAALHQVEMEDEAVVESVQRGIRSRLYDRGRYSPSREQAVHHFHRLLAGFLTFPAPGTKEG